jgi:hypothetical protein
MDSSYQNNESANNIVKDLDALYESVDKKRRIEAIKRTDSEKFFDFTRMIRITHMLKNAKITHKKMP